MFINIKHKKFQKLHHFLTYERKKKINVLKAFIFIDIKSDNRVLGIYFPVSLFNVY